MILCLDFIRRFGPIAVVAALSMVATATASEAPVAVRLPGGIAAQVANHIQSPAMSLDYGSFSWWLLAPDEIAQLEDIGIPVHLMDNAYVLTLGEESFDPLYEVPRHPLDWMDIGSTAPDLHLVQAVAPIRTGWLDDLRSRGLEPVQYIHPFTYMVWGHRAEIEEASSAMSWVRWHGAFAPAYRVLPRHRQPESPAVEVSILVANIAGVAGVIADLETLGVSLGDPAPLNERWSVVAAVIEAEKLADVAGVPGVVSIQPTPTDGGARSEMSNQVCADNVDSGNLAFPGYWTWLNTLGLDGDGVVMANVDQGVDQDHPDLAGRVLPCTGVTCGSTTSSFHGTHTAGIQSGTGASGTTSLGFLRGLGMAPGAMLVEQLYSPFFTQPDGMLLLMGESHSNGALLSSNSWGPSGSPLGYDIDTLQTDIGVRDVDSVTPGNQAFTYVLSIMNGNGGTSSQGTPDEAKNLITVGSTKMKAANGSQFLEIDDLSSNSAHGPALDGRHIPHIVAPGCRVDSAIPGGHGLSCGTSMASPHVSGTAALLVEQWRLTHGGDPSPAMIKALLTVSARDLAGNLDADGGLLAHPFDSKQGWGRLNAQSTLAPSVERMVFDDPLLLTATGEEWITTLTVDDDTNPVRVMLVWTDAPGHGLGGSTPAWNNDLDLIIEADGLEYPGNNFDGDGWSIAGVTSDGMNNTEGVFLPPATSDEITIRVRASNLNSDGVPGNAFPTDQDFAIVVDNAIESTCEPGTIFNGDLALTELVVNGAQAFDLQWLPATPLCGGVVRYSINDARSGLPGTPIASTDETAMLVVGGSPGAEYCFVVESSEDGAPGEESGIECVTGSGVRIAGDLDCDGDLDPADLELVVATIFGAAEPMCAGYPAADANLDGVIDASDLTQVVRAIHNPL